MQENQRISTIIRRAAGQVHKRVIGDPVEADGSMSVTERAHQNNLPLTDFIKKHPRIAVRTAEAHVAYLTEILRNAAFTGEVVINGEPTTLTKIQASLLEKILDEAIREQARVFQLAEQMGDDNEMQAEHLARLLYMQASKGNMKAMAMLLDRHDGRVSSDSAGDLDEGYKGAVYQILHTLFDKQLEVLNAGWGRAMIKASRQSGKTRLSVAELLIQALVNKNTRCLYIGETMTLGMELVDGAMQEIIESCDLRDTSGNRLDWQKLDNGSSIMVRGLSNTKDPNTIRGLKAKVIVIDEYFHLNSHLLQYLEREILQPMQLAYAPNYKYITIGTPAQTKGTYGQQMWETIKCPKFHWDGSSNPYIPNYMSYVQEKCEEEGVSIDSPWTQREYFARDVYETDILLYPVYHTYDSETGEGLPDLHIDYVVCGLDYGIHDFTALIAIAWDSSARQGFVLYEDKFNGLTCGDQLTPFERLKEDVLECWQIALDILPEGNSAEKNKRIIWLADFIGSDQMVSKELCSKVQVEEGLMLQMGNARGKHDRVLMQDKLKALLKTGSLLLPAGGPTANECEMTIYKKNEKGELTIDIDDKYYHPDLLPAMRYALWPMLGPEITHKPYEHKSIATTIPTGMVG